MADDPALQLRPATPEEWPVFLKTMVGAFGETPTGPYTDIPPPVAEMDRSLGLWDRDQVVATAGIYSRQLTVPGAVVPCAGITWVTVAPTHRRRGVLTSMMRRQLTEIHEQGREPVAALWASESSIYGRFGYAPATVKGGMTGRSERLRLRPDIDLGAGRVDVVPLETYRPAAAAVYDAVRRFVPGNLARDERWWTRLLRDEPDDREGATERRFLLHTEADGTVTGYATFRMKGGWTDGGEPDGTLIVEEARASTAPAYASLWKVLLSVDLVRTLQVPMASADDPLRQLVTDPRALNLRPADGMWVRLVDVGPALSARRYPTNINLVFEVRDEFCPWNAGRWHVWGHPAGAFCDRTDRDPDLVLGIEELSAAYLGGVSLATLQAAGRVTEISPGAVTLASTAFFWPVTPWCPEEF
ncbi:GNAT family N-acetyltransferase [Blastococcus sp. CT_GayMR16]|uniref:GNAT family N-acetyltransferase n=1 Tax=Blastococcus sp. CT_GayMR16 TaxID=2559607 RepID=UPI0010748C11|nr:GNAT family N-acetyltransferase [Blastococcus sp. CT_GayMR16]TFV91308.1 GNAT family N-acetyltransferase [Blastococcus sp. CT_GayMR16]